MISHRPINQVVNILSIDVEEWYHGALMSKSCLPYENRVRVNTEKTLDVLAEFGAKGTFFFVGSIAEQHPQLVRRVQFEGHEVASHGYAHLLVNQQTRTEFYNDVKKSLDVLQNITGSNVKGYRAPSWSISNKTPWAYDVLAELGLMYDASLFPFTTFLYGDSHAPIKPFVHNINGSRLYVVPATVLEIFGHRMPFGGGFYFRVMPLWATRLATHLTNCTGRSVVFYIHPHEIDPEQPRMQLPLRDYFISYANLSSTLRKFKKVLSLVPTISIYQHLECSGIMNDDDYYYANRS